MKGSNPAPALGLTTAVNSSGAAPQPASVATGGKGQEQAQEWDCLWEAVSSFTQMSTLGWRLPQAICCIGESLSGRSWRNSSMYLFLYFRKRKVATIRKTHNWLLWRHVSQCDNINYVLYQLGSWSQGALVRERSNSSLIIGKLLPWETGLEGRVCQTSPISTTIFYIVCICKSRVVIISDLLQTSRKHFNSDVTLAMCITDNTMYFQAIHKGIFLCLSFLQNGNGATR